MKKIILLILSLIMAVGIFSGCGKTEKPQGKNPSVKDISEKIKASTDLSNMKVGDENKLKKIYDIGSDEVAEFALFTAPSNLKADEIAILKLKDEKSLSTIKAKIEKRIEAQSKAFKDYLPDEYFLIEKRVLKTKDNYILFVISKDVDKISSAFDECFK